ncbi:5-methyltetrahydropteroyltriglutamate--homocysteine S-methyltransferase [Patulibacter sp. NPDC049589]|uniref:5-methyltetrahydropteroyltriglutamate-- homocysteine S-methyltransferase n=1 Tax=Patulibacter sp. NPDC049589 TaxID=3154731 RepID=UPI00343F944E
MARTAVLGFPRIGADRELKVALEAHWAGRLTAEELQQTARGLRTRHLGRARQAGIDVLPIGDQALYDHVLDAAELVGLVAPRHGGSPGQARSEADHAGSGAPTSEGAATGDPLPADASVVTSEEALRRHFLACRGDATTTPLEMTKWLDTNYHYLVPEIAAGQTFALRPGRWLAHLREARQSTGTTGPALRPVVLGPLSLLLLGKPADASVDRLALLPALVEVYGAFLDLLAAEGVEEVQLDEPVLVLDRTDAELDAFAQAYGALASGRRSVGGAVAGAVAGAASARAASAGGPSAEGTAGGATARPGIALATYFDRLDDRVLRRISALPLSELHVDLVRAPQQLDAVLDALPEGARLSAGVVDGRNVWATDPDRALDLLDRVVQRIGSDRVTIAPSCSLLHAPYRVSRETGLDDELRSWLAFGEEKLDELALLHRALGADAVGRDDLLQESRARIASRRSSPRTNDAAVRSRAAAVTEADHARPAPIADRLAAQKARLGLPLLPTTTIGSYPQTSKIRNMRRRRRSGDIDAATYEDFLKAEIDEVVRVQEELDLDVLVHGEPERNDMVEYFGEQLEGFAFSAYGWVQSYGSRCVKPPILFGDVSRPKPMTVSWWAYAQSRTARPMKGMLTGPVTILQWSFVRDDQPRQETCRQIGLAIQDEVVDLEAAGCAVIQVDEAALREGLPLRREDQDDYVRWAVDCFRLTSAPARPDTQIHTHMCYSEFNEMIEHIARLDADVLSVEASRSGMELLEVFSSFDYPGEIGPGVYDIHAPRVPTVEEIEALLVDAQKHLSVQQLWVNPDCGLKTRGWEETLPALRNLVEAARRRRVAVGEPAVA